MKTSKRKQNRASAAKPAPAGAVAEAAQAEEAEQAGAMLLDADGADIECARADGALASDVDCAMDQAASADAPAHDAHAACGTLVLASHCGMKDAAALKQSLCEALAQDGPVQLDVSAVERVDTATMQLLCAFVRDRAEQQRETRWLGDSSAIREAARLLGITNLLSLPPAATSGAAA